MCSKEHIGPRMDPRGRPTLTGYCYEERLAEILEAIY